MSWRAKEWDDGRQHVWVGMPVQIELPGSWAHGEHGEIIELIVAEAGDWLRMAVVWLPGLAAAAPFRPACVRPLRPPRVRPYLIAGLDVRRAG